jgi:two-component sensor histidine kinase
LTESRDEDVKDFVINRNPEFALQIVHKNLGSEEEDANEKFNKYIQEMEERLKVCNQIKFENLNYFFKHNPEIIRFCAREKKFKPGSG